MSDQLGVNLEVQFLKVLLDHSGNWVRTSEIAKKAGWLAVSPNHAKGTAIFIGRELQHDGLVSCRKEEGEKSRWYARIGTDD